MAPSLQQKLFVEFVGTAALCFTVSCLPNGSVERRGTGIATPSSRRRVDDVEVVATIQHERAVKY